MANPKLSTLTPEQAALLRERNRAAMERWRSRLTPEKRDEINRKLREKRASGGDEYRRRHAETESRYRSRQPFGIYRTETLAAQGGVCALCGGGTPLASSWHVDHDHSVDPAEGQRSSPASWRGVTCRPCNVDLIATYESNPSRFGHLLPAVAEYVRKWSEIIKQRLAAMEPSNASMTAAAAA